MGRVVWVWFKRGTLRDPDLQLSDWYPLSALEWLHACNFRLDLISNERHQNGHNAEKWNI